MDPKEILAIVKAFFDALKEILITLGVMKKDETTTAAE